MRATDALRRARYRTRRFLGRHARLYRLSLVTRPREWRFALSPDVDVVIEGFPRCGNNFAFEAFRLANPEARIASRTHAPAQVRRAVELGLPTIVVVREPDQAASSLVVRQPYLHLAEVLRDFAAYYEELLPLRAGFVVGEFGVVTADYATVIEALNARAGTSFTPYENTPVMDARTLDAIERHHREVYGGRVVETHVARPSEERERMKRRVASALDSSEVSVARERAKRVYERMVTAAAD